MTPLPRRRRREEAYVGEEARRISCVGLVFLCASCIQVHHVSSFSIETGSKMGGSRLNSRTLAATTFVLVNRPSGQRICRLPLTERGTLLFGAGGGADDAYEDDEGIPRRRRKKPSVPSSFSEDVGHDFDEFLDDIISRSGDKRHGVEKLQAGQLEENPIAEDGGSSDDMRKVMEQQQKQIDMLMKMVQQQQASGDESITSPAVPSRYRPSEARKNMRTVPTQTEYNPQNDTSFVSTEQIVSTSQPVPSTQPPSNINVNMAPLKAMLFIDGTWLYYSLHRRGIIERKYGRNWRAKYSFDWAELPRVICEEMQKQVVTQGWDSTSTMDGNTAQRPVEIVRACVFTSYKKNTMKHSDRVMMFEDMSKAGYDVHIMETVGDGEKCIDIQLAVEMLHYATVPGAYDVAILLSGDKDFLPALMRTRQKARKVAIVSTKNGCNQALLNTPNIKDYDIVWIEDHMDRLITPLSAEDRAKKGASGEISPFTVAKVIRDMIQAYADEKGQLSSRDIGRGLKQLTIGDISLLEDIKATYGGIRLFVDGHAPGVFDVHERPRDPDALANEFWLSLPEKSDAVLAEMGKGTEFSEIESIFLREYLAHRQNVSASKVEAGPISGAITSMEPLKLPADLTVDYSVYKVADLKERCRERGLPVSGTKAVLLERVQADVEEQKGHLEEEHKKKLMQVPIRHRATARIDPGLQMKLERMDNIDPAVTDHISSLTKEYIHACGGKAGSRDLGRYLATNKAYNTSKYVSALHEVKEMYGSLVNFIMANSDTFSKGRTVLTDVGKQYGFPVWVREEGERFDGRSSNMSGD